MKSLGEIQWALNNCPNATHYLHVSEDFDVDIQKLETVLESGDLNNGSIWCQTYQEHAPVKREGRWMVPMDEYFKNYFPSYCSGGHYFLANDAAVRITAIAHNTENFRFHDVHISGILRMKANLPLIKPVGKAI